MYQLVQLAATFDDQSSQQPDDMDLLSNNLEESNDVVPPTSQSPTTLEEPHSVVQQLQNTVEFLTAELGKAHLAIQNLQNQLQTIAPHASQRPIHTDVTSFPTVTESSTNNKTQFPDAPWHNPAKVDAIKQPLLRQRELRRAQREAAAARFFQPPSPNQGFKYLYIPTKVRIPVGTLRAMFRRIGVNNARLLDIHYPTRNTAAILIHNDFETEFTELSKKHHITLNENFDPNNGSILEDPKLKSLSDSERDELAKQYQITRLERAVQHIRVLIKYAVAHFFYEKQWISKKFYNSLTSDRYPQVSNIFTQTTSPLEINPNSANLDNSSKIITDDDFDMSDDQGTQTTNL
ncbi:hypothetical protein G6F44_005378 [Rhizopus delemar]|nr:hypothetical protein G6F44_005378 [Rhizopus delemar]